MNTGNSNRTTASVTTSDARPRLGKVVSWRVEPVVTADDAEQLAAGRATGHILGAGQ